MQRAIYSDDSDQWNEQPPEASKVHLPSVPWPVGERVGIDAEAVFDREKVDAPTAAEIAAQSAAQLRERSGADDDPHLTLRDRPLQLGPQLAALGPHVRGEHAGVPVLRRKPRAAELEAAMRFLLERVDGRDEVEDERATVRERPATDDMADEGDEELEKVVEDELNDLVGFALRAMLGPALGLAQAAAVEATGAAAELSDELSCGLEIYEQVRKEAAGAI